MLFLLAVLFTAGPITAQTVHVYYKKQTVPNYDDIPQWFRSGSQKQEYIKTMESQADNARSYYSLFTDGRNAEFVYDTTVYAKALREEQGWGRFRRMDPGSSFYWHNNLRSGMSVKYSTALKDDECYAENIREKFEWKFDKGVKVFSDILCNKAYLLGEKGDTTIAWFAPSIRIPAGPEEYGGLPGMILALEAPGFLYIAEEVNYIDRPVELRETKTESCMKKDAFEEKALRAMIEKMMRDGR